MSTAKKICRYIITFAAVSVLCVALLVAAAYIPQERVYGNISRSVDKFKYEGTYPRLYEGSDSAMLDNFTDSVILMETMSMNSEDMTTVFSNPMFLYKSDPLESLVNYCENPDISPDGYYVRYWMGFRATLRLLFSVFTYAQLRKLNLVMLALLAGAAAAGVARNVNVPSAAALLISLLLVRPMIIARNFQYVSCFAVALSAMIFVPLLKNRREWVGIYFMVVGMLTQYFDFYTVPALTACMPLLYYQAMITASGEKNSMKDVFKAAFGWMLGYVGIWVVKLLLSSLFTETNGVANGLGEFMYWMSMPADGQKNKYFMAFNNVWHTLCPNTRTGLLLLGLFSAIIIYAVIKTRRGELNTAMIAQAPVFAAIAIPLIWFAVAATPTMHHAFFQYRSVAAVMWGISLLLLAPAKTKKLF